VRKARKEEKSVIKWTLINTNKEVFLIRVHSCSFDDKKKIKYQSEVYA
jgi:hypothetical protein